MGVFGVDTVFSFGDYLGTLKCPISDCSVGNDVDYLHILDIGLVNGESQSSGRYTRGVQAVISFDCEFGHRFDLVFAFHKGQVFVAVDNVKENADV